MPCPPCPRQDDNQRVAAAPENVLQMVKASRNDQEKNQVSVHQDLERIKMQLEAVKNSSEQVAPVLTSMEQDVTSLTIRLGLVEERQQQLIQQDLEGTSKHFMGCSLALREELQELKGKEEQCSKNGQVNPKHMESGVVEHAHGLSPLRSPSPSPPPSSMILNVEQAPEKSLPVISFAQSRGDQLEIKTVEPCFATLRSRCVKFIRERTPWKQTSELEHEVRPGIRVSIPQQVRVHVVSHGFCLILYAILLVAYASVSVCTFFTEEPVESFSSAPSKEFGSLPVDVLVTCAACEVDPKKNHKWSVGFNYEGFDVCEQLGAAFLVDQDRTTVDICRTTDNIRDARGITIRLEHINETLRYKVGRPTVDISAGDMTISTPLEAWHEKTLLFGLTVYRDDEDCTSASDCDLKRELYLSSMQYDGKVAPPTWVGAKLNIRMLRFANVYTRIPQRVWQDVLASIGGASGILILVLGASRHVLEAIITRYTENLAETCSSTVVAVSSHVMSG